MSGNDSHRLLLVAWKYYLVGDQFWPAPNCQNGFLYQVILLLLLPGSISCRWWFWLLSNWQRGLLQRISLQMLIAKSNILGFSVLWAIKSKVLSGNLIYICHSGKKYLRSYIMFFGILPCFYTALISQVTFSFCVCFLTWNVRNVFLQNIFVALISCTKQISFPRCSLLQINSISNIFAFLECSSRAVSVFFPGGQCKLRSALLS